MNFLRVMIILDRRCVMLLRGVQVSAMARSFRWGPFLPVRPDDTLLHVLLLLSKHRLKAVPVVDAESSKSVRGFITQVLPSFLA